MVPKYPFCNPPYRWSGISSVGGCGAGDDGLVKVRVEVEGGVDGLEDAFTLATFPLAPVVVVETGRLTPEEGGLGGGGTRPLLTVLFEACFGGGGGRTPLPLGGGGGGGLLPFLEEGGGGGLCLVVLLLLLLLVVVDVEG